jgi:hypothetical protein
VTFGKYPDVRAVTTAHAHVSDWVLVGSIDSIGLSVLGEAAFVRSGSIVARLTKSGSGFAMDGILTGRLPFRFLVSLVGRTEANLPGFDQLQPLCSTPFWSVVGSSLCAARDIMEDSSRDRKGDACDAASVAIGFAALPARASDFSFTPTERTTECDASVVCE